MSITSTNGDGVRINSSAVTDTIGAQTQTNGSDEIVLTDTFANLNNGNVHGAADYSGDNRKIILRQGTATEEARYITGQTAGTGTTVILTVNEPWDSQPQSGESADVSYNLDDCTTLTGCVKGSKTGVYEFTRNFRVGDATNFGYFAIINGQGIEVDDDGTTRHTLIVHNNGRLDIGYEQGGQGIQGGFIFSIHNAAGELFTQCLSGGIFRGYDYTSISWLQITDMDFASGGDVIINGAKWKDCTYEIKMFAGEWNDMTIAGKAGGSTENVRLAEETSIDTMILASTNGLTTASGDTTTETLTVRDVSFLGNTNDIVIESNKTWDVINPEWVNTADSYSALSFSTATGNRVNEKYSLDITVADPSGTAIDSAGIFFYEGLQTDDLEIATTTDSNGVLNDSWLYTEYLSASATVYGNHALRVFKYGKSPFISAQTPNIPFSGTVTLIDDNAITESSQSTALTNGAGITPIRHGPGETDTRPMKALNYDGGTGTVPTVGETITQGSATGVVVEYIGNAASGTLLLDTWNGTEFTDNQTMSGSVSGFNGVTDTTGFYQEYTWEIDCNSKALSAVYDYLAAEMAGLGSPAIGAIYEQLHEWGGSDQGQAMYSSGTGYYTERSLQEFGSPDSYEGVWLSNRGGGTFDYFTSDAGVQFSVTVVTVRVQGVSPGSAVKIIADETVGPTTTGDVIFEKLADADGIAEIGDFKYEATYDPSGLDVIVRARSSGLPAAAIQDDNGTYTDETEDANTVVGSPIPQIHLLPTVPVVNQDGYLFGHYENFNQMKLVINTPGTGGFTITWQYWNGAWTNLSDVVDGTSSFSVAGKNKVSWTLPGDAVTTTINGQGPFYYVKAAYTAGTVTIVPSADKCTLDVTRYLPFVQNNTITSSGLTVTASWIEDTIATF